jgi:undecaprenyl-diphosphatase
MAVARAVLGFIEERDQRFMRRMQRWRAPRPIRAWMLLATRLGDGLVWYAVGIVVLCFGGQQHLRAFACGGSAALVGILVFKVLKGVSRRQRPCEIEPHCWAMVAPTDEFSFPSGHTMTACAITICIAHFYPAWELSLVVLAASIAASRIVLGMHFLSDVLAGAMIGAVLGFGSLYLFA